MINVVYTTAHVWANATRTHVLLYNTIVQRKYHPGLTIPLIHQFIVHCLQDLSGGKLCTFNLHLLACQLLMQFVHRGLTAPLGELWIERLVGGKKGRSKGGTKSNPEVTMMIDELVTRALRRARLKYA